MRWLVENFFFSFWMASPTQSMVKIIVVGGGVVGLSTAVTILNYARGSNLNLHVEIWSDEFTPHTTSDVAVRSSPQCFFCFFTFSLLMKIFHSIFDLFSIMWTGGLIHSH
jgi:hypothetical protein